MLYKVLVEIVESALFFDVAGPDDVAIDALIAAGVAWRPTAVRAARSGVS
jgi:hypothetical protein